eukprot:3459182-Amphidinium_carterae.1
MDRQFDGEHGMVTRLLSLNRSKYSKLAIQASHKLDASRLPPKRNANPTVQWDSTGGHSAPAPPPPFLRQNSTSQQSAQWVSSIAAQALLHGVPDEIHTAQRSSRGNPWSDEGPSQ